MRKFTRQPPPEPGATNAELNYLGKSRVWVWQGALAPEGRVMVKEPGFLAYHIPADYPDLKLDS